MVTEASSRSNEKWIRLLGTAGAEREEALGELRSLLLRGLGSALAAKGIEADLILEDLVQESLLKLLDNLDSFEGRSRFVTWAVAIGVRTTLSELRRKRWQDVSLEAVVDESALETQDSAVTSHAHDARIDRSRLLQALRSSLEQDLTVRQRQALLAELAGMPQARVAELLETNRNALYKLTHDARRRLKQVLETAGFSVHDLRGAFGG